MSLDRLQSRPGNFYVNAEPGYTVASSLSSVASNQLPGGYQFGSQFAVCPAGSRVAGGGGLVMKAIANQTYAASSGTGAMVSHDGAGIVLASLSNGGLHNLQPPSYNGQLLTVINIGTGAGSLVTGAVLLGQGSGSTTTVVIPTLTNAVTFGPPTGQDAVRCFVGLTTLGSSNSNSTHAVWSCTGGMGVGTEAVGGGISGEVFFKTPIYGQTYAASSGTGAMITHDGAPLVLASLSAGGLHCIQPPRYDGQILSVINIANVSGSIVTGAIISGQGTGSTTTYLIPTLTNAVVFASSAVLSANRFFVGFSSLGGTSHNSTYAVWSCYGAGL